MKEYDKEGFKFQRQIKNIIAYDVVYKIDNLIVSTLFKDSLDNEMFEKINFLISSAFKSKGINTPYSWGFIDYEKINLLYISDSNFIDDVASSHYRYLTSIDKVEDSFGNKNLYRYSLVLFFPKESTYVLSEIYNILLLFVSIALLVIVAFAFSIQFLFKQRRISEQKNDYINHMTHEVKTPVATTLLAIEALNDKAYPCNEEMRATYLNIILKEILRLQELVLQILNRARKENIDNTIQKELIDIHPIIEEAVESMSLRAKEKGGIIQSSLEAKNTEIYGSPVHITNIIMNLMENAIKYTPQNPCIQISTLNTQKGIEIRIQDNGIGVAPPDQKKIFKKYYRASNHPNKESFGVGLNYVQHVVKLHKGNIKVESEPGIGSTFIIYLKNG